MFRHLHQTGPPKTSICTIMFQYDRIYWPHPQIELNPLFKKVFCTTKYLNSFILMQMNYSTVYKMYRNTIFELNIAWYF